MRREIFDSWRKFRAEKILSETTPNELKLPIFPSFSICPKSMPFSLLFCWFSQVFILFLLSAVVLFFHKFILPIGKIKMNINNL